MTLDRIAGISVTYSDAAALAELEGQQVPQWFTVHGHERGCSFRLDVLIDDKGVFVPYRLFIYADSDASVNGHMLRHFRLTTYLAEAERVLLRGEAVAEESEDP